MARLTVEDCLGHVENRFDLILKASKRARLIERGAEPMVDWDNDKPTVLALREIANGLLDKQISEDSDQASKDETQIPEAEAEKTVDAKTEEAIENAEPAIEQKENQASQTAENDQEA